MNKLIPLLAFSVLLLVPTVAQNAFAHKAVAIAPFPCPPFVDPGGTATHSVNAVVSGSSVSGSYPGVLGIPVNAMRAYINLGGTVNGPFLVFTDTSSPYTYQFNNLAPGTYTVVACFMTITTTLHTSSTTFTIAAPPPTGNPVTCGLNTFESGGECVPDSDLKFCGEKTIPVGGFCVPNILAICSSGTTADENVFMCFAETMGSMIGGTLLEINTVSLLVGSIGVNPVITGLVGITLAGITGQAVWFVHRRNKSENS